MSSLDDKEGNDGANALDLRDEPRSPGFQFRCDCCLEDCFGVPLIINPKHEFVVDAECAAEVVVPQILEAKANEYSYPAAWGNVTISYRCFLHLLPADFRRDYRRREKEYRTPLADRIYCRRQRRKDHDGLTEQCGTFLGRKLRTQDEFLRIDTTVKDCYECNDHSFASCMHCGQTVAKQAVEAESRNPHNCKEVADNDATAFDGLGQGVHYQICPGCEMKVELAEACNALICRGYACRTSFCAICGQPAAHNSGHWQAGKPCPRWKKPSDPNAGFDTEPAPFEQGEEEERDWDTAHFFWHNESNHWRRRPWNRTLVRDEACIIRLLDEFNLAAENSNSAFSISGLETFIATVEQDLYMQATEERSFDEWLRIARARSVDLNEGPGVDINITLSRVLLILVRDAIRLLPLFRGVGLQLTTHHVEHLSSCCSIKQGGIRLVGNMIPERTMRHHPGLTDILHRTLQQLDNLVAESETLVAVHERGADEPLPTGEDPGGLIAKHLEPYRDVVADQNVMARRGIPQPGGLDVALGMFWLQYSNLELSRLYPETESFEEKYTLLARFGAQHQQIQQQRPRVHQILWPAAFAEQKIEIWARTMEAYDEAAARFMDMIPPTIIDFDRQDFAP